MASFITYLGYLIDSEGIHPKDEKKKKSTPSLRHQPLPMKKELKAFLGLIQFYAICIPNVWDKFGLFYYLLRKGVSWRLRATQLKTFQRAKDSLQCANVYVN